jgi:maleate isomerase
MIVRPKRIGMITPSSNTVVEPVTIAMTAPLYPRVTCHFTRIEVKTISLADGSLAQFDLPTMLGAARLLADAGMDAIVWNGTSGAWRGLDADRELCAAITAATGAPATTSTLAQIDAFAAYGVRDYALAVPYLESVCRAIPPVYAAAGLRCVGSAWLGISTNTAFADVAEPTIRELVARADRPTAEAVAIICTNFPAAWLVESLEAAHGKPVFDSTVLAVWQALRLVGHDEPLLGWGRLLREAHGGARA